MSGEGDIGSITWSCAGLRTISKKGVSVDEERVLHVADSELCS